MQRSAWIMTLCALLALSALARAEDTSQSSPTPSGSVHPGSAPPAAAAPAAPPPAAAAPAAPPAAAAAPSPAAAAPASPSPAAKASPPAAGAPNPPPSAAAASKPAPPEASPARTGAPPQSTPTPAATAPSAVQKVSPEDAEAILGQRVFDQHGETIGRLIDVLVDASGQPRAAVIDFGGFMGVGNRRVAVHWSVLQFNPADPVKKVVLDMTPDQIKAAPEYRSPSQPAPVVTPAAATQSTK